MHQLLELPQPLLHVTVGQHHPALDLRRVEIRPLHAGQRDEETIQGL
ncbi:hypothetical protein NGM37_01220 [Streptomyces sp. TRM76130]|nr:hypothetical protein [Streptomyces sp. TRM76130]